jgi:hypothetical protein
VFVSGPTGNGNAKLSSCLDADFKSFSLQGVTNYVELGEAKEIEQGKGLVDAIKQGGVKLFVWSSLAPTSKLSKGRYKVKHFDTKVRRVAVSERANSLGWLTGNVRHPSSGGPGVREVPRRSGRGRPGCDLYG